MPLKRKKNSTSDATLVDFLRRNTTDEDANPQKRHHHGRRPKPRATAVGDADAPPPRYVNDDEATFAIVTGSRDGEIGIHSPDRGTKLDGASAIRSPVQRPPRPSTFLRMKYALGRLKFIELGHDDDDFAIVPILYFLTL
jgi:hypothetical protein